MKKKIIEGIRKVVVNISILTLNTAIILAIWSSLLYIVSAVPMKSNDPAVIFVEMALIIFWGCILTFVAALHIPSFHLKTKIDQVDNAECTTEDILSLILFVIIVAVITHWIL